MIGWQEGGIPSYMMRKKRKIHLDYFVKLPLFIVTARDLNA